MDSTDQPPGNCNYQIKSAGSNFSLTRRDGVTKVQPVKIRKTAEEEIENSSCRNLDARREIRLTKRSPGIKIPGLSER